MKKVNISVMKINNKAFDSASGYLRYIAKRPGVEKMSLLSDNRHQTKNQKEIIRQICLLDESIKDYPQYRAYVLNPCRFNAGSLISSYIRNNPSSKDNPKLNCYSDFSLADNIKASHGLFNMEESVSLDKALKDISKYRSTVWTLVLSLKRKDAEALGFNKANSWLNFLRSHIYEIAECFDIKARGLNWYAAFHNNTDNPHVHLVLYCDDMQGKQLSQADKLKLEIALSRDIYRMSDYISFNDNKKMRNHLTLDYYRLLGNIKKQNHHMSDECLLRMQMLYKKLQKIKTKRSYRYMSEEIKEDVSHIINEMLKDKDLEKIYTMQNTLMNMGLSKYYTGDVYPMAAKYNPALYPLQNEIVDKLSSLSPDYNKIYNDLIYSFLILLTDSYENRMQELEEKTKYMNNVKTDYKLKAQRIKSKYHQLHI